MDEKEKYLNFCEDNELPFMTTERTLEYFKLRKNAAIECLNEAKTNPNVTRKVIEYWIEEIEICNKNIKKIQL